MRERCLPSCRRNRKVVRPAILSNLIENPKLFWHQTEELSPAFDRLPDDAEPTKPRPKKRPATLASPENCSRLQLLTSSYLVVFTARATTRRTSDGWEDTEASAPWEREPLEPQRTQMCLPNLPTTVTP